MYLHHNRTQSFLIKNSGLNQIQLNKRSMIGWVCAGDIKVLNVLDGIVSHYVSFFSMEDT